MTYVKICLQNVNAEKPTRLMKCIRYFTHYYSESPDQDNLRALLWLTGRSLLSVTLLKRWPKLTWHGKCISPHLIVGPSWRAVWAGPWRRGMKACCPLPDCSHCPHSGSRDRWMLVFRLLSPFYLVRSQPQEMLLFTVKVGLLSCSSVDNPSQARMILDFVKFAILGMSWINCSQKKIYNG